jgi:hypothetical protein
LIGEQILYLINVMHGVNHTREISLAGGHAASRRRSESGFLALAGLGLPPAKVARNFD